MKQHKIWFIDDPSWKDVPDKGVADNLPTTKTKTENQDPSEASRKNPALSFSLSMVLWGSGQMYAGAYRPGSIFMAAMVLFYSTIFAAAFLRDSVRRFVAYIDMPRSVLVPGAVVFLSAGLVLWLVNAVDAYYRTVRSRSEPFRGVDNELLPLVCSVLFPGWGQFLNGQPKKGIFFLVFGAAGICSAIFVFAARHLWPLFKAGPAASAFEICLVGAFLLVPLSLMMWIVSLYDSFSSCKDLFLEKLRRYPVANGGRRRKSLKKLLPRWTAVLGLLLAISVGCQLFPEKYYLGSLEKIRAETLKNDMVIVPRLAGKVVDFIRR
jgi:TM2 domain-containing membrane protein YozV